MIGLTTRFQSIKEVIREAVPRGILRFHSVSRSRPERVFEESFISVDFIRVYPTVTEALKIAAIGRRKDPAKLSCCAS